jgi:hypothetical protein
MSSLRLWFAEGFDSKSDLADGVGGDLAELPLRESVPANDKSDIDNQFGLIIVFGHANSFVVLK